MRRERFEIKYYFPLEKLGELIAFIRPFMVLDRYCDGRDRLGGYKIRSLYYDSPDFDFYRTHLEGYQSRRKLRIRKYTYQGRGHYFLEIKNKVLFSTNKYRIELSGDFLKKAVEYRDFKKLYKLFLEKYRQNWLAEMVHFDILALKLAPIIFISYSRLAYNSRFEHDVRLTVDFNIEASKNIDFLRFKHQRQAQKILPGCLGILELKANRTLPRWLQDVILHFRLTRRAFSKYKEGVEKIYNL